MKKINFYILIAFIILVAGVTLFTPDVASAQQGTIGGDPGLSCSLFGGWTVDECVALIGYYAFYVPTAWILIIAGGIFDTMLALSLSTKTINQPFVLEAWGIVRDVANLFFIFILLYIAIGTILQTGGDTLKRALVNVIIVAFVINFSFFFTRVVIDASNIFALEFYSKIGSVTESPHIGSLSDIQERSITAGFVSAFNPQRIIASETFKTWQGDGYSKSLLFVMFFVGAIINLVASYVFFLAGFLFVARVVAFMFLIIASPLAFMAYIVPNKSSYANSWWTQLVNQALVAPVFLFFIYVITKMIVGTGGGDQFMKNAFSGVTTITDLLINMVLQGTVIVVALLMGLRAAQKLSGEAGTVISEHLSNPAMKKIQKYGGKGLRGAGGTAYRRTGGALASWAVNRLQKGKPELDENGKQKLDEQGNPVLAPNYMSTNPLKGKMAMSVLNKLGAKSYKENRDKNIKRQGKASGERCRAYF